MLVAFDFRSLNELDFYIDVVENHKNDRNEEFNYCVKREKAAEILACRALDIPYVVMEANSGFTKESTPLEWNFDEEALAPTTKLVMRTSSSTLLTDKISNLTNFIQANQDIDVKNWPSTISKPSTYLRRELKQLSCAELNLALASKSLTPPLFIKGVDKGPGLVLRHTLNTQADIDNLFKVYGDIPANFTSAIPEGFDKNGFLAIEQSPDWFCEYRESMEKGQTQIFAPINGVIISEVIAFEQYPDHAAEYRCFIIDGKVSSISSYSDYDIHPIPPEVSMMAAEFAADNAALAPAYVADFGVTDKGVVLIELNKFSMSGRYAGNDPVCLYRDIAKMLGHLTPNSN